MAIGELRYKGMLFGDDLWATIADENMPYKSDKGVEMKRYLILPSEDLVEAYPEYLKKPGILNVRTPLGYGIWVEYPTELIIDENPSKKNAIARIECGFDGRDTPCTRRHAKLLKLIKELRLENEGLRIGSYVDREELFDARKDWRQRLKDIIEINKEWKGGSSGDVPEDMFPQQGPE